MHGDGGADGKGDEEAAGMISPPYIPNPIDTSSIKLSEELLQIVEQLARNVHENWVQGRINDGWTYGPERSDALKQHPCLVDYDSLPESEKEYDRKTAVETLKFILIKGWSIEKKPTE